MKWTQSGLLRKSIWLFSQSGRLNMQLECGFPGRGGTERLTVWFPAAFPLSSERNHPTGTEAIICTCVYACVFRLRTDWTSVSESRLWLHCLRCVRNDAHHWARGQTLFDSIVWPIFETSHWFLVRFKVNLLISFLLFREWTLYMTFRLVSSSGQNI